MNNSYLEKYMKALVKCILILAISFTSCNVNKSIMRTNYNGSSVRIDCQYHEILSFYFTGKVTDINTNEELEYAEVVLRNKNGTDYYGVITDPEGNFAIDNLPLGDYNLQVSYFDHEPLNVDIKINTYSHCVADVKLYSKPIQVEKPVIYLYPVQKQKVHVKLHYAGALTHTYPKYPDDGWTVTAEPNGTLWDENNQEYYALFWEGTPTEQIIPEDGFVVSGKETAAFLEEKLAYLGLNRREANEFIMYWLPRMENNPFNFIHFTGKQYEEQAVLEINPTPETMIRVMMLTQPLENKINIPLQDLSTLQKTRKGFTLVEWGGSVIDTIVEEI